MVRLISGKGSERAVQGLKLRLLAAMSGVSVTVACAAGSGGADAGDGGRGGDSGSAGSSVGVAGGGAGGTTSGGMSGTGGSMAQSAGSGGTGGKVGSSAGSGAGPSAGKGGAAPSAGTGGKGSSAGTGGAGGIAGGAMLGGAGGIGGSDVSSAGHPGRPFLVAGERRVSAACPSSTWRDSSLAASPALATLPEAARRLIADYFTQAALMEHASIAAFARFSLELVALGAPPELVSATTAAMLDETRHARLCFELASRYAGRDIGPGPLDVTGALGGMDLASVVERALLEGCIGETAAALEARFALEGATDPVVRSVLAGIAEDEERHAALAFRFVTWAVDREPRLLAALRARVAELADAEPRMQDALDREPFAAELRAHGVSSLAERQAARAAALTDVVPELIATLERKGHGPGAVAVGEATSAPRL